jgi:cell division FtsZ-interacting protein ZapD
MDIETRKIRFIRDFLKLKNEDIIEKLEHVLYIEKKEVIDDELSFLTIDELISIIERAENDAKEGKLYNAKSILKDIDAWK